jgi:uncharacterized membrane protein YjfL (UPF0719 family)
VFVDVISVSAVLYIINFANCYQNGPKYLEKKLRKKGQVRGALGGSERIVGISIISYRKNSLDLRPT